MQKFAVCFIIWYGFKVSLCDPRPSSFWESIVLNTITAKRTGWDYSTFHRNDQSIVPFHNASAVYILCMLLVVMAIERLIFTNCFVKNWAI